MAISIAAGWATILPLGLLVDHMLLREAARWLGAVWLPTVRVCLDCMALAAAGWTIGRVQRRMGSTMLLAGALGFTASMSFTDLDGLIGLNVPWLLRLGADAVRDSVYRESFAATAGQHILLLGCLFAGMLLSKPARPPLSIQAPG